MKVTFLLTWADGMGGTEHAGLTQAAHLSDRMTVEVISVFQTGSAAFFEEAQSVSMRYLIDARHSVQRPVRQSSLSDDECLTLSEQGSELINRQWEGSFNRLSDLEMQHALSTLDTDVLVTTTPALTAGALQLVPARVVVVEQEHRPSQFRGPTGEPLLPFAPHLDALVALTDRTRAWLGECLGSAAPRLLTIANAIPQGFRPRSSTANRVIVMAGRLVKDKRYEDAIKAFDQVADAHPDWTMRIFGDGPERNRLKRRVDSLGRHDRIFLPGSSASMSDEWAQAGLMALSSKDGEAMPLVLLEAYAAGVPAVAYDIATGPAEVIRHEVDGLLIPAGNVELLGESLGRLMGDDEERAAFGKAAWQRSKDFSAERIVGQWESLFAELVADRDDPERMGRRLDRVGRRAARGGSRFHPSAPADRATGWRDDQSHLEKQIAADDPTLVYSGGRLAAVDDALLHPDAVRANLLLVADALESAGIEYVVLAGRTTPSRIAVAAENRPSAVEALAKATDGQAVYAELLAPRLQRPGTVLTGSLPTMIDVRGLRVFRPVVTTGRTLRYGPGVACDLEFWPLDDETGNRVAALGATVRGRSLPSVTPDAVVEVAGRSLPTRSELVLRDTVVVDEPIDAVWTWVDDSDPRWRERRNRAKAALGGEVVDGGDEDARFRDRDELRYSMRSVAMYAPWIRHHYLVTDDQVPSWLDTESPDITVVSHRDIFTDPAALPTFNSHSIGSQLHHIEGLAEQFLVFNDDVFLGRPMEPRDFFSANGAAKCFPSSTQIGTGAIVPGEGDYLAGRKNARDMVKAAFGRTPTHGYLHAPHAMLRSLLAELEERFGAEFARTAASRFRDPADVTILSGLHHEFGWLTRRVQRSSLRVGYVNTSNVEQQGGLSRLLTQRDRQVFCLNDGGDGSVTPAEQALVVRAFLEAYFPVPGPFERRSPA